MDVTKILGYFVTIVTLLPKCSCVGIEYYDDKNLPEDQTDFVPYTNVTRSEDVTNAGHNVTVFSNTNYSVQHIRRDHFSHSTVIDMDYRTTLLNFTSKDDFTNTELLTFPLDAIKEYEYIYDEEAKPNILRMNSPTSELMTPMNSSMSNVKTLLTDFYNLEPAVHHKNFNVQRNYSECYSVWYVVQDLPCWELPVLYGEFGKQKKTSEVFLMHGGKLKNVMEKNNIDKWKYSSKTTSLPLTYYTNKWCKSSPCYGDHTLCLFSDKRMSSICNEGYKVGVPSISEQTALINKINSMRNKVANGESDRYSHLPPAANMKQIIYDYDLENFARVWLLQCLPGPNPCSALDGAFVNQLECTKYAKFCCFKSYSGQYKKCTPKPECFISAVIGCLYVWFWSAGDNLTHTDVHCGHTSGLTYSTAQLLWATTYKIGCAYGKSANGDERVVCNFSPRALFALDARMYCGMLSLKGGTKVINYVNISDTQFLKSYGINIDHVIRRNETQNMSGLRGPRSQLNEGENVLWGIEVLHKIYSESRMRKDLKDFRNGTKDMIARLVLKYKFIELNGAKCDSDEPIYVKGSPGSLCVEKGSRYNSLCYDFVDPIQRYRLVAVVAPIALFFLILYDLFSGIVRQTNY